MQGGLGLQRVKKRLARPIPKAEELRFYSTGDKQALQSLFRTEPRSLETSGGRGVPGPGVPKWQKVVRGCAYIRPAASFTDAISGEVWAETPTCCHEESTSVT